MQVGNLKTGLLYDPDKVPREYRWFHRMGNVEVLRSANGDRVGLVGISHDASRPYWDFEEIGMQSSLY